MSEVTTINIPPNIVIVDKGLVCIDVDTSNGLCKTWALMEKPAPLMPTLNHDELNILTSSILGLMAFTWVILAIKRAI